MQAKNLKKQAAAKARSAALTPAQSSKIAAKAALKKARYPSAEYVGTLSLGKLFKKTCCQAERNNFVQFGLGTGVFEELPKGFVLLPPYISLL